jgi:hypothetical protein
MIRELVLEIEQPHRNWNKGLIANSVSGSGEVLAMRASVTALELMREEGKSVKRFYEKNDNDVFF